MSVANSRVSKVGLFLANPMVAKLDKVHETDNTQSTAWGIIWKTLFLLFLTVVGIVIFFSTSSMIPDTYVETIENVQVNVVEAVIAIGGLVIALFFPYISFKFVHLAMILGSLYSIIQGYALAFAFHLVGTKYVYPAMFALVVTIAIIAVMLFLYKMRLVRIDRKFVSAIVTTIIMGIILVIIYIIVSMIPACSEFVQYIRGNQVIFIIGSVVGIVIASLFLLVDFEVLRHCVEDRLPKKYEWLGAFALAFSVIELYLKVLNFIIRLTEHGD